MRKVIIHNTKLELLDDLGNPVDDLGFAQIDLRTFWRLHRANVKDGRSWQGKAMTLSHAGGFKHARGQATANKTGAARFLQRSRNEVVNHL